MFSNERGATMLEFALVSGLLFGLLGILVDFGIGIHKYALVTHATNTVARKVAIQIARESDQLCTTLDEEARESATKFIKEDMGLNSYIPVRDDRTEQGQLDFLDSKVAPLASATGRREVQIVGHLELNCILCGFFGRTLNLTSTSRAAIERQDFSCEE